MNGREILNKKTQGGSFLWGVYKITITITTLHGDRSKRLCAVPYITSRAGDDCEGRPETILTKYQKGEAYGRTQHKLKGRSQNYDN